MKVKEILQSLGLVLEENAGKEITESSILKILEKNAEDNTSRLLNRGVIADLPLLRTLLAIH